MSLADLAGYGSPESDEDSRSDGDDKRSTPHSEEKGGTKSNEYPKATFANSFSAHPGQTAGSTDFDPPTTGLMAFLPPPRSTPATFEVEDTARQPPAGPPKRPPGRSRADRRRTQPLLPPKLAETSEVAEPYPGDNETLERLPSPPVEHKEPAPADHGTQDGMHQFDARTLLATRQGPSDTAANEVLEATRRYKRVREAEIMAEQGEAGYRKPTALQRKRHHINQLAHDAARRQLELEDRQRNGGGRQGARLKYGW